VAKSKISRPIVYIAVLGVAAYAVVLLTEPEKTTKKTTPRTSRTSSSAPKGFLPEDLKASFPRYAAKGKNAFQPKVVSVKPTVAEANAGMKGPAAGLASGVWMLTGINTIDGVRSALVENGSTGDTVFLKTGDIWNGMRVASIDTNGMVLVNPLGKRSRFGFPTLEEALPAGVPPGATTFSPVAPVILSPPGGLTNNGTPVNPVNPGNRNIGGSPQGNNNMGSNLNGAPVANRGAVQNNSLNVPVTGTAGAGANLTPGGVGQRSITQ
jgi:hypothetical protein